MATQQKIISATNLLERVDELRVKIEAGELDNKSRISSFLKSEENTQE